MCWILPSAFFASIDVIMWFLFFSLFMWWIILIDFLKGLFWFLFYFFNPHLRICSLILKRNGGREREREMWERSIDWLPPIYTQSRDWTHNLDLWPNRGSNPQHFGAWGSAPTYWATGQSTLIYFWTLNQPWIPKINSIPVAFNTLTSFYICLERV